MSAQGLVYWAFVVCLVYLLTVYLAFGALLAVAIVENLIRRRESDAEDYDALAASRFTIPVSIIAPAYNEEVVIVDCVRSLLAMDYPKFEVIVVNDGSSDRTLERLTREFDLEPLAPFHRRILPSAEVRGINRSKTHPQLVAVDKMNGGKADALNCGVNLARFRYVCCVDGDTVYTKDALLKGMRLVMKDPATIVGVTSHIATSARPERDAARGFVHRIDRKVLSNFQLLDYLRAFLINRLAWSRWNFMLCSVGAFAIWRRDVVLELGGFSRAFTCEDIEFTFRVHNRFLREGRPRQILALPDLIGTTEGPDTVRRLVTQRARWQRVIMETVWHYRRMFLNPRYGLVGMIGMPFYVLSEVLAPFMQTLSVVVIVLAPALGLLDWSQFVLTACAIAFSTGTFTNAAILLQDSMFRTYPRSDVRRLVLLGPLDLVLYRPIIFYAQLKGAIDFLRGDKQWHKFERNRREQSEA